MRIADGEGGAPGTSGGLEIPPLRLSVMRGMAM